MSDTAVATPVATLPFTIASRPQGRFSNVQTVNNLTTAGSFQPIPLPATGWVRMLDLFFTQTGTCASGGAVVAGDGPFNLVTGVTLSDALGSPIMQPISGYNLYLVNKYFGTGRVFADVNRPYGSPAIGAEYAYSVTGGVTFNAAFRLRLDLELDWSTGYGSIPNLDANAALQLKIDYALYSVAFTGTTVSVASLTVRVEQHYWSPVSSMIQGKPASTMPPGAGDYVETRIETLTVNAASQNLVQTQSRGGLTQGALLVSRAAGVRTAYTAGSEFGIVLDNQAIYEGCTFESWQNQMRQAYGMIGAELSTSYAPLSAGILPGLDRGVIAIPWGMFNSYRDTYLSTRGGSLLQYKLTPGTSATDLAIVTRLIQTRDASAFYARF